MEAEFVRPSPLPKRAVHSLPTCSHSPIVPNKQQHNQPQPPISPQQQSYFPSSFGHNFTQTAHSARMNEPHRNANAHVRSTLHRHHSLPNSSQKPLPPATLPVPNNMNRLSPLPTGSPAASPSSTSACHTQSSSSSPLPPMPADFSTLPQAHSSLCSSPHFRHGFLECLDCLEQRHKKVAVLSNSYQQFQMDRIQQQRQQYLQAQLKHTMQGRSLLPSASAACSTVNSPVDSAYSTVSTPSTVMIQPHASGSAHSQLPSYPSTPMSVLPCLEEISSPIPATPQSTCQLPETPTHQSASRRQPQFFRWDAGQHNQTQSRRSPTHERKTDINEENVQQPHSQSNPTHALTEASAPRTVTTTATSSAAHPSKQRLSPLPRLDSAKLQQMLLSFSDPDKISSLDPNECLSDLMLIGDGTINRMIGEQYQLTALTHSIQKVILMDFQSTNRKERKADAPQKFEQKSKSSEESHMDEETEDDESHTPTVVVTEETQLPLLKSEKLFDKSLKTDKDGAFLSHRQKHQHKRNRATPRSSSSSPAATLSQVEKKRRRVDSPSSISTSLSCDSPSSSLASSTHTTPTLSPTHSANPPPGELSFLAQIASLMR